MRAFLGCLGRCWAITYVLLGSRVAVERLRMVWWLEEADLTSLKMPSMRVLRLSVGPRAANNQQLILDDSTLRVQLLEHEAYSQNP